MSTHSARGPALGYYYQAIFALISLFDSQNDNAFVSIETLDDVYHEDGVQKNLIQLKHKTTHKKISIKDDDLWKTLKVWCDFILINDPQDGIFTLSTVASIKDDDPLNVLKTESGDRSNLEILLLEEAQRIIDERKKVINENIDLLKAKKKEKKIPFNTRYKGCESFKSLTNSKRQALLKNTRINTSIFPISDAPKEVISRIKKSTQSQNQHALAESIIAWWDREAVRSLTRERNECIYLSELQEFVSKKNAELYNDGFTDDIDEVELPPLDMTHPIHIKQLEIINASVTQKRRSFKTEIKARIQRDIWMNNNFSSISKLKKYDESLIEEWSYRFDEIDNTILEDEKQSIGRDLLDWCHNEANGQVRSISQNYNNPDLVRGSFQMLSKDIRIGWHCDYKKLIKDSEDE